MSDLQQLRNWQRMRMWDGKNRPMVGASSMPALLGLSRFKTREDLLADYATPGVAPKHEHSLATLAGTLGEPMVLGLFERQTDRTVIFPHEVASLIMSKCLPGRNRGRISDGREVDMASCIPPIMELVTQYANLHYFDSEDPDHVILRSRNYPWLSCSPDAFWIDEVTGSIGIVEAKLHGEGTRRYYGGEIKEDYRAQVEQQGIVTGLEELTLAAYFGTPKAGVAIFDTGPVDDLTERIVDAGREFCDEIRRATLPPDPFVGERNG